MPEHSSKNYNIAEIEDEKVRRGTAIQERIWTRSRDDPSTANFQVTPGDKTDEQK
jgi:hypothetical protein